MKPETILLVNFLAELTQKSILHTLSHLSFACSGVVRVYWVAMGLYKLGLTPWNLSCFELKFDDTMIPDFPQFSFSKLRQPTGQRLSNVRKQQTKIAIRPILFLYYEESLISSNVNSKQLRFDGAHPKLYVRTCLHACCAVYVCLYGYHIHSRYVHI